MKKNKPSRQARSGTTTTLLLLAALMCGQSPIWGQQDTSGKEETSSARPASEEREVSLNPKKFARNFFSDQKMIWTFPAKAMTGSRLVPTLAVLGAVAGTVALDPAEGRYFRRNGDSLRHFNNILSETNTTNAIFAVPVAFYGVGLIGGDKYVQQTGLLALEAWIDIDILDEGIRTIARRRRPIDISPQGNFSDTWLKTATSLGAGGFPSGHTGWAFAVATVVAHRHSKHKWVPYVAYGLAAMDAFSRLSTSQHFASDILVGAVLGYSVGRFVVLRK